MCGIFGRVHRNGKPIDDMAFLRQLNTMVHRGPDAYGISMASLATGCTLTTYNRPPQGKRGENFDVGLGHRRLSILDLSETASQPMSDQTGKLWVTFNGEVYNFAALRRQLAGRGHIFRTDHSDTEVLIYAFKEWGERCLDHLRGMFAFAILDLASRRLFLARDRIGKKPLYFSVLPNGLQFASELKAILADGHVPRRIDPVALAQYLTFNYIAAPRTIFQDIRKLPAGHFAWVELDRPKEIRVKEYWNLHYQPESRQSVADWIEEFDAEFAEAVRLRMVSDVPLGVLLSGGIDSTLVVRAMSRVANKPVKTFSIGFQQEQYSELKWAREVSKRYGTEHYEEVVRPNAIDLLPKIAAQYDEPFADDSALPTYYVSQMARRHVTVVLTGDGGDELFAGYNQYGLSMKLNPIDRVPLSLRRLVFGATARFWPENMTGKGFLSLLTRDPYSRYLEQRSKPAALRFLAPELRRTISRESDFDDFFVQAWSDAPSDSIGRLQYVDTKTYLPEDILVKVDRATMVNSLEARSPLLDHKVVELAARIPSHFKLAGQEKKYLLKQILARDFNSDFISRRKTGFGFPMNRWFRTDLANYVRERLLSANGSLPTEINRPAVKKLVNSYKRGNRDLSGYVWNLLMLDAWTEVYGRQKFA
jgi:asparagine synthase (glutamine-hydrolysing)